MTVTDNRFTCPGCGAGEMTVFYEIEKVPVHSVLLLWTREEAVGYPAGRIALGFCPACGFISNVAFDPALHDYGGAYESTQGFSPTFNAFHRRLALDLIERYDVRGQRVIEIGCGQGEFLSLLCELGGNEGIGFDPAYDPARSAIGATDGVTIVKDFYSEKYADTKGDFVCCKMTLEHIWQTAEFVGTVRRAVGDDPDTTIFFQVPNARYVFGDLAFWDIYYEHCSYFSLGSMARLFRHVGFEVLDLWTDYDDQYLMIVARPGRAQVNGHPLPQEDDLAALRREVAAFAERYPPLLDGWRRALRGMRAAGRRVVLWGGGSKAVSFLTTLGIGPDTVAYAVDINPNKTGSFLAGTGQEVVAPAFLQAYRPDVVIVMNPVYVDEIGASLQQMGLAPELLTVHSLPAAEVV